MHGEYSMSTTLTNGLKLPDKGSVDWYADMQNNYTILDGAVGTIAEHSTQIAGKAPLVHTHTKSDVTDLFNSANIWSGDNTYTTIISYQTPYTLGNPPQSAQAQQIIRAIDTAGTNYLAQISTYQDTAATGLRFTIRDKFNSNGFSPSGSNRNKHFYLVQNISNQGYLKWDGYIDNSISPLVNNTYDLGSSSHQWNNLYAKNYYYNGVAWGLDKANAWSANNAFTGGVTIYKNSSSPTTLDDNSLAFNANSNYIFFRTKGSSNIKSYNSWLWSGYLNSPAPNRFGRIKLYRASALYGETGADTPDTSFSFIDVAVHYKWVSLTDNVRFINDGTNNACEPLTNNATDLGTSDNKWKTLNGCNPGALSLPNLDSDGYVDLSSNLTENVQYSYTPTVDGWLTLFAQVNGFHAENAVGVFNADQIFRWANTATAAINLSRQTGKYYGGIILPVKAGYPYYCWLKVNQSTTLGLKMLIFYKAKGNV